MSDPVLSKQVSVPEGAGYGHVTKGYVGERPRTWVDALGDIAGPAQT